MEVHRTWFAQIILGSDYSGSAKEIQRLLQPGLRKEGLKKSLNKMTLLISGSKSRDTV